MDKKITGADKFVVGACLTFIIATFVTAVVVMFTQLIIVDKLHVNNGFTKFLFAGNDILNNADNGGAESAYTKKIINWEEQYPFENVEEKAAKRSTVIEEYDELVKKIENKISPFVSKYLVGYDKAVELAHGYDGIIDWNFVSFSEYNGISELPDGYLAEFKEEREIDEWVDSLVSFKDYVESQGIDFLYVQAPGKVSDHDDTDISGYVDFSNQNADNLIAGALEGGVEVYDLRDEVVKAGIHNHDLFYRTDHHWKISTGLWGAQKVLEYCNENYGFNADTSLLDPDAFEEVLYPAWFLGSQGKKVTLSRTTPDDIALIYPRYETKFHYVVPAIEMDATGDYSIFYDMDKVKEKDYYNQDPYGACNYTNQPVIQIDNLSDVDDKKILIIHESFGNCVISPLAICEKRIDSLDLRYFTGSIEAYIKEAKPDIVIVMYNVGAIGGEIDWASHKNVFDFR